MHTTPLPLEQARACAQRALELLSHHGLPPAPVNYAVAYEFHAGVDGELHAVLDRHLQAGKPLDEFLLGELYERHVATDRVRKFQGMRNDLQGLLQNLLRDMAVADDRGEVYRGELERNIQRLESDQAGEALRAVASDLLDTTRQARQDSEALRGRLDEARREAEELRGQLELHRREALIDPLTGLFNRRALDQQLASLWTETESGPLSVLALDIDHFKRINDTYGHAVGDVVLRHVAETVRKCIRGEDLAVRFGGEEFLVLLPGTPKDGAVRVAENIRGRVAALRLTRRHDNLTLDPFTISLGVAVRHAADDSHESLFERADKALYQAKGAGRNRVMVSDPPAWSPVWASAETAPART